VLRAPINQGFRLCVYPLIFYFVTISAQFVPREAKMATITKTPSGTYKVQIRKSGIPSITKTCKSRTEAETTTVGELIDRYI